MHKLAIIGAGPGGYVAALAAAKAGIPTVLIEKEQLGGTCLNFGCIPTKALIAGARLLQKMKDSTRFGINAGQVYPDFEKMQERKSLIVKNLRVGIEQLLKSYKVEVLKGEARLLQNREIIVRTAEAETAVQAENMILSTGSEPRNLPNLSADGMRVLDSSQALSLGSIPSSLIVIGGGVIGLEFAHLFAALGSQVTVVEIFKQVLPGFDSQVVRRLALVLKKQGIRVITGAGIKEVKTENGCSLLLENGEQVTGEKILLSVGRKAAVSSLADSGIELANGRVKTDETLKTNIPGIYAIGDMTSPLMLAHVASAQAEIAVRNISGHSEKFDYSVIPSCVFTSLDLAVVGKTEDELKEKQIPYKAGSFNFAASSMAQALGETEGLVKILADPDGQILGAQAMGEGSPDLIHEISLAMKNRITVHSIAEMVHAHPTLSETVKEAAADVFQAAIHKFYR
ncbi:MAG: dihydrolipoyl dehydrogenase [Candidatus Wallbacteria bacterium]|nr:dihydrolipoyl dehydrogenase [Candidatus Wallbacteria bacterium]